MVMYFEDHDLYGFRFVYDYEDEFLKVKAYVGHGNCVGPSNDEQLVDATDYFVLYAGDDEFYGKYFYMLNVKSVKEEDGELTVRVFSPYELATDLVRIDKSELPDLYNELKELKETPYTPIYELNPRRLTLSPINFLCYP